MSSFIDREAAEGEEGEEGYGEDEDGEEAYDEEDLAFINDDSPRPGTSSGVAFARLRNAQLAEEEADAARLAARFEQSAAARRPVAPSSMGGRPAMMARGASRMPPPKRQAVAPPARGRAATLQSIFGSTLDDLGNRAGGPRLPPRRDCGRVPGPPSPAGAGAGAAWRSMDGRRDLACDLSPRASAHSSRQTQRDRSKGLARAIASRCVPRR